MWVNVYKDYVYQSFTYERQSQSCTWTIFAKNNLSTQALPCNKIDDYQIISLRDHKRV